MKRDETTGLRLAATDLANHLACHHLTRLEVLHAHGEIEPGGWSSPVVAAIAERGDEHEKRYLEHLRSEGVRILDLSGAGDYARRAESTRLAIEIGTEAIIQAVLTDGRWLGIADVLRRVERPSDLGGYSYEVYDTKLARETAGGTILQLCLYSELLEGVQGKRPEWMHVVPPGKAAGRGSGRGFAPVSYRLADYFAYYRLVKERLLGFVGEGRPEDPPATYPDPVPHCQICRWFSRCDKQWRDDDHLSLVAGISKLQREELSERGVERLEELARLELPLPFAPERGSAESYERVREQARLQLETRERQELVYEMLPVAETGEAAREETREEALEEVGAERGEPEGDETASEPAAEPRGLARLPEPSALDVFFDIEGDHFAEEGGREYLFGWAFRDGGSGAEIRYEKLWALEPGAEKEMFESFVAELVKRRQADPGFHVYHFAPYEPAALKRLMGRYAVCDDEIDELLRAEVFVDLYSVVRQAVVAGVESYSIKKLEPLYGYEREEDLRHVTENMVRVERALELGRVEELPEQVLAIVERYNRDDCVSTLHLRDWLEARRSEMLEAGERIPRPVPKDGEAPEDLHEREARFRRLRDELLATVPVASAEWSEEHEAWSEEEKAIWRLAHMLEFHRREGKASWWEYYRLAALGPEELLDEKEGVAGLTFVGEVDGGTKKCPVHRYSFPLQETSVEPGDVVHWGRTEIGTVRSLDAPAREIDIKKRGAQRDVHPPAVFAFDYVRTNPQEDSLYRLAEWVLEHGVDGDGEAGEGEAGENRAARDLLLRLRPRVSGEPGAPLRERSEDLLAAARRLALELGVGTLPVQGPPGAGKTHSGSRMITSLVEAGRTVGITANSHKVIRNLVEKVVRAAKKEGVSLTVVQKVKAEEKLDEPPEGILEVTDNAAVLAALEAGEAQVAAGTAWLWSREEYAGSVDTLVVDEAGQLSLANTLAVAQAGRALILLGDPRQLEQPLQASHPEGTDRSALEHVLGEEETLPAAQGLFLDRTWRLPPAICELTSELFYENRLESRPGLALQELSAAAGGGSGAGDSGAGEPVRFAGAGLWLVPVEHVGNQSSSAEEVEAVAAIVAELASGYAWTDAKGETKPLGLRDILVVAPFNAQVALLSERLGPDAKVGTVDRFQGQEAPVVLYSMTTSTPEDAPRGMEFLYSLNRFNVATSRAQCATLLVASPALFEPECRKPRQMELANAYCRYRELATILEPPLTVREADS